MSVRWKVPSRSRDIYKDNKRLQAHIKSALQKRLMSFFDWGRPGPRHCLTLVYTLQCGCGVDWKPPGDCIKIYSTHLHFMWNGCTCEWFWYLSQPDMGGCVARMFPRSFFVNTGYNSCHRKIQKLHWKIFMEVPNLGTSANVDALQFIFALPCFLRLWGLLSRESLAIFSGSFWPVKSIHPTFWTRSGFICLQRSTWLIFSFLATNLSVGMWGSC